MPRPLRLRQAKKSPAVWAGLFIEDCGECMHSNSTTLDQAIRPTFSNPIALQMIGTVGGDGVTEQWIGFSRGHRVAEQGVGLSGRNGVAEQWIGFSRRKSVECENR